jgi:hypothetical protein
MWKDAKARVELTPANNSHCFGISRRELHKPIGSARECDLRLELIIEVHEG